MRRNDTWVYVFVICPVAMTPSSAVLFGLGATCRRPHTNCDQQHRWAVRAAACTPRVLSQRHSSNLFQHTETHCEPAVRASLPAAQSGAEVIQRHLQSGRHSVSSAPCDSLPSRQTTAVKHACAVTSASERDLLRHRNWLAAGGRAASCGLWDPAGASCQYESQASARKRCHCTEHPRSRGCVMCTKLTARYACP